METLKQIFIDGWPVLAAAPVPALILMAVAAVAAWWLHGSIDQGEIRGLKAETNGLRAQIAALEERLRLATDEFRHVAEEKKRLDAALQQLQRQIEAGASQQTLTNTSSSVAASGLVLDKWLTHMGKTVTNQSAYYLDEIIPPKKDEKL